MNAFESSGDLPAASEAVQFKFEPRCTGDGDLCHCEETRSGKRKKLWNTRKKQFSKEDINENNGAICALCGAMHCGERLQAIRLLRAIDANYHCTMGNKRPGKRICHRWAPANEGSEDVRYHIAGCTESEFDEFLRTEIAQECVIPRITPTDADRAVLQAQLAAHAAVITGPETAAPAPQPPGHPAIGTAAAVPPLVIPTGGSGHHGAALEGTQTAIVSPAVPQEALPPCTAALAQAFAECLAQLANDEECGGDSVYAILKTIEKMKDSRNLNTHRVLKGCSECRVDMEMICYAKDPEENSVRTAPDVCLACGTSRPELQNGRVLCCAFAETRLQTLMNYFEKHDLPIAAPPGRTDEEAFKAHLETIFPLDLGINKISGVPSPLANPEDVVGLGPIPLELLVNELELALRNTEEYRKAEASIQAAASKEAFDEHKKAKHIGDHDKEEAALRRLAKETVEGSLKGKSYNPKNKKQPYFQGNLSPTTACSEVMRKQWVESSNIRQEGRKMVGNHLVNFASWSILVLIGTVGAVTPLHLDWTSAANVAFAVTGAGVATVNLMMPLAEWIFIHPSAIPAVNTWLKEKYKSRKAVVANGLRCGKDAMPVLQEKQFEDLQRFCGVGANGVPLVRKLYQYHGDWIHFLPGYLHQVITLQPCVKFAWDVYELAKFPAYIAVWRDLIAQFTAHPGLPADYSNSTPT